MSDDFKDYEEFFPLSRVIRKRWKRRVRGEEMGKKANQKRRCAWHIGEINSFCAKEFRFGQECSRNS